MFVYSSGLLYGAYCVCVAFTCRCAQLALASPENVQCRSVFIQFLRALVSPVACCQVSNVQPVFDSRHGRIACKIPSKQFTAFLTERDRLQSGLRALHQPLGWLTAALPNSGSHFLVADGPNIRWAW